MGNGKTQPDTPPLNDTRHCPNCYRDDWTDNNPGSDDPTLTCNNCGQTFWELAGELIQL